VTLAVAEPNGYGARMQTRRPNGRQVRDRHRFLLLLHFTAMIAGLGTLAAFNRSRSPGLLWVQWPALLWLMAFAWHLWRFNQGTMATMGKARR